METNDNVFSWSALFFVTAFCFLLFNGFIKILDGYFSPVLFAIAGVSAGLAVLNEGFKWLIKAKG